MSIIFIKQIWLFFTCAVYHNENTLQKMWGFSFICKHNQHLNISVEKSYLMQLVMDHLKKCNIWSLQIYLDYFFLVICM